MSSPGTGSDISEQVVADLLHKLMTESAKVQAIFTCPTAGVQAVVSGVLRRRESDGTLWVMDLDDLLFGPKLRIDPFLAVVRKYGDDRAMRPSPDDMPKFTSALSFIFADGSTLGLFEFAVEEE